MGEKEPKFVIEVVIGVDDTEDVKSKHQIVVPTDYTVSMRSEEQIVFGMVVEALRREIYLGCLIKHSTDPELKAKLSDPEKKQTLIDDLAKASVINIYNSALRVSKNAVDDMLRDIFGE